MDYRAWIDGVRSFSEGLRELPGEINVSVQIDPPLSEEELRPMAAKWPNGIPDALRMLWTEGSSRVNCPYVWTPPNSELSRLHQIFEYNSYIYGGVRFEAAGQIFPRNSGMDPADDVVRNRLGEDQFALWCNCAIFLGIENGDCLGLDLSRCPHDPAVVYLTHDGPYSSHVSSSFTSFLTAWTQISFIGPEHWLLDYWVDPESESIDPERHMTTELRRLLSPRTSNPIV